MPNLSDIPDMPAELDKRYSWYRTYPGVKRVLIEDYATESYCDTALGYAAAMQDAIALVKKYRARGTWYIHNCPDRFHVMNSSSTNWPSVKISV
jgi:hypothetical protein